MASQAPFGNDPTKVERYRAFWDRAEIDRPLVGFSFKSWFPLEEYAASAAWQSADHLTPDMVEPRAFMDDQERLLREGETLEDDIFRGACPSQAVHWLVAMLGVPLRIADDHRLLFAHHLGDDAVGELLDCVVDVLAGNVARHAHHRLAIVEEDEESLVGAR